MESWEEGYNAEIETIIEELEEEFGGDVEHLANADEKPFDILVRNLEREVKHYSQKMWNSDILGDYLHGFGWAGVIYPDEIKVRLDSAKIHLALIKRIRKGGTY